MTDMLTGWPTAAATPVDEAGANEERPGELVVVDDPVVCTRIVDVTHDVRSFSLQSTASRPLRFHPGQYLTVAVAVDGEPLQRCYTISSPPTRSGPLTITVKRVPGGPVSNWMHDHVSVGDTLSVTGPLGRFSIAHHRAPKYLFLSAGSGITPLMSMARTLGDRGEPTDVVLVHGARTPRDIIFRAELEEMGAWPCFSVAAVCEADSATERWSGPSGRLSWPMLRALAPDMHDREIFTCGPPAYMQAVREMLATAGVDPRHCHEESFDLAPHARPSPQTSESARRVAVEFRRSRRTFECHTDETVLDAALREGLTPPSMCGEGWCGTCKTTLLAGGVEMSHAGGIRDREIDQGKVLICCSTPRDDLVIDA